MDERAGIELYARAAPLADLPIEPLLARREDLARRWTTALVLSRPLGEVVEIPFAELAADGPALCAATLHALRSERELRKLLDGWASRAPGQAPGLPDTLAAGGAVVATSAIEALRGELWDALAAQLATGGGSPRLLAAACDRLAHVCSALLQGVLAARDARSHTREEKSSTSAVPAAREAFARASSGVAAVIVDERPPAAARPVRAAAAAAQRPVPDIAIRDQRAAPAERHPDDHGPAAWMGSIGAQLERYARDGRPFAVLLAELVAVEAPSGSARAWAARLSDEVEALLRAELRLGTVAGAPDAPIVRPPWPARQAEASITRERPGRFWLVVPGTDRVACEPLRERLRASASAVLRAGMSAALAVGAAVCPQDGSGAAVLAAHADVDLYAARSALRAAAGASGR